MATHLKILCVGLESGFAPDLIRTLRSTGEVHFASDATEASSLLATGEYEMVLPGNCSLSLGHCESGAFEAPPSVAATLPMSLTQAQADHLAKMVVDEVSDGLVLVDSQNLIV